MKCPACGFDNIEGVDRCEECMAPFRDIDIPLPKGGFQAHILLDPVRKITTRPPDAVSPDDSVRKAAELMQQRDTGCVLVIKEGKLHGILTEVDLLSKLDPMADPGPIPVSELMTSNPEVVQEDTTITYAINAMSVGGYRHLPVIRDGQPVGVISIKDLLQYIRNHL